MHYANGREAQVGDPVITKNYTVTIAGTLHSLNAGCGTCNAQLCYPIMGGTANTSVTVGECYHAEDALAAITPKVETVPAPTPTTP